MRDSVKGKLCAKAYKILKLSNIKFPYGNIEFLNEATIDDGQAGFRYNPITGDKIGDWIGDDYVVIGYDYTAGLGPNPYIVKTSNPKLPVYWLMSDSDDWSNPELICESLEHFSQIFNILNEYRDYFSNSSLTQEIKEEILSKIRNIETKNSECLYWDQLLDTTINGAERGIRTPELV